MACTKIPDKDVFSFFNVTKEEFHIFKEGIKTEFQSQFGRNDIGENPDFAWCGTKKAMNLCFISRIKRKPNSTIFKEYCTGTPINLYQAK